MKLKLVVASMSVLGLISSPVFAAETTTTTTTTDSSTATPAPHKHHKKYHHVHHMAQSHEPVAVHEDYKAMGALPMPVVDTHQIMYNAMSQNTGRSVQSMPDWFNRIGVSGGVNFDAHWGNLSQGYEGENRQHLSLNDAYINVGATVNDWTKAFTSFSYSNPNGQLAGSTFPLGVIPTQGSPLAGQYSNVYFPVAQLNLEQGYLTLANYDVSPVFFQVGKQFTDYGRYVIHPFVRTMSQVMTESLQTSAKLGFITQMGFHGDISAFDNTATATNQPHTSTVWGAALGFDQLNDQLGFDVGVGYMSNLTGVNDIAAALGNAYRGTGTYVHLVGGIAVYADVNSGPFALGARYTTSIQHFNPNDISTQYGTPIGGGARPWALDVTGGFGFNYWAHNQNLYVGYQTSNNAVNLAIPKNRYIVGYDVDMWKNTNVGIEYNHDTSYSSGNGATNHNSNTFGVRGAVKFG